MSERARVLKVGGTLLGLLVAGLVVGFLALGREDPPPPAPPTPAASPISAEAQVEQAYLHAWDVWAQALLELDPSLLPEALTGDALEVVTEQVETQREANQPVRVRVEHDYRIVVIDEATASVEDRYVNHNVRLDPDTLEPMEDDPDHRERTNFTMRLVEGTWKIAEIIEYESS